MAFGLMTAVLVPNGVSDMRDPGYTGFSVGVTVASSFAGRPAF
jgi:hypothetical protein